jgi:RimJ/RimL family protein N-acetyltransferase
MSVIEPISTDRLVLRELMDADFGAVHAYAGDANVCRFMNWGPNTEEDTRGFISRAVGEQSHEPRRVYTLAICLKDAGLIGGCSVAITDEAAKQGFIGYVLHRAHWGKGYATECGRALLSLGFGELGLHRIWTDCDTENRASARVLEKIGMRREGTLVENKQKNGSWRSSHVYAVLSREMSAR